MVVNETLHKELDKIPTVKAIPLEKVKQAIEEIEQYLLEEECNGNHEKGIMFALEILKRNIGENKCGYAPDTNVGSKTQAEHCEDCVSRKSLKYKLQEHHDFFVNACGGFSNLSQNDKTRVDEITNCIAMLVNEPPVTPTQKWIPVSERLPKPYTFVNATCRSLVDDRENWVIETLYLPIPKENNEQGYSDWGNIPMLNWHKAEVIAWMERKIPEPYKESEET